MTDKVNKKKNPYNDYMSIVKTAIKWLERSESKIRQRLNQI